METIFETAKTLGTAIAEFILLIIFCKRYIEQNSGRINIGQGVKEQSTISKEMLDRMDYYRDLLRADRILLFEFHNGQHYSNYRSALKMSVSHEVHRADLSDIREKCTGLPIAVMPHFVSAITNEGKVSCADIEEIKGRMGSSYEFKKSLGIQSFYDVAIRDTQGNVIGFVAVQWEDIMPEGIQEKDIAHLAWFLEEKVRLLTTIDRKAQNKKRWF